MFDQIFDRWIATGQLTQDDLIPLFLEWNQTFGDGKATPEEVIMFTHMVHADYYRMMQYILKMVSIKRGYVYTEIWDTKTGKFVARFLNSK